MPHSDHSSHSLYRFLLFSCDGGGLRPAVITQKVFGLLLVQV